MNIAIVGAGIAGLTTAIALNKKGIGAVLYEASPEIKELGAGLGLAANAIKAFEYLGLKDDILKICNPIGEFLILDQNGHKISSNRMEGNYAIHRAGLQQFLLNQIDVSCIHLGKKLKDVSWDTSGVTLQFLDGDFKTFDYVIIADGIHSVARQKLTPGSLPRYAGYTCWRAIVDNSYLKITKVSETWGAKGRFGMVPLHDNQLYWFACINATQKDPKMASAAINDLAEHFKGYHGQVGQVLQMTVNKDLIWSDIIDIKPISQFAFGRIVLIGDAAHATTPNMGQGACQAIEDAVVLSQCMAINQDFEKAFIAFEGLRLKRTQWITNTSWRIGKMAQMENKVLIKLRNMVLKRLPDSFGDKQQRRINNIDAPIFSTGFQSN